MKLLDIIYVIIMSIVEGITEWLPISSTAHLILVSNLCSPIINKNIFTPSFMSMFDVVIQLGAILAVVIIFHKRLIPNNKENIVLWGKVVLATIPALIVGLLFDEVIDKVFFNLKTISITLITYGFVFIFVEKYYKNKDKIHDVNDLSYKKALMIGLIQILAIIPGTSRSGITIIAGLLLACNRKTASTFSFFLSIPVMLGASSLKTFKYINAETFTFNHVILLLIGIAVAFLISMLVVKFLMNFTSKHNFIGFGYYRILLGIAIIFALLFKFF